MNEWGLCAEPSFLVLCRIASSSGPQRWDQRLPTLWGAPGRDGQTQGLEAPSGSDPQTPQKCRRCSPILKVPPQLHCPPAVIPHKLPHLGHGDSQRETAEMSRGSSKAGLLLSAVRGASYVGSCWKGKGNGGEGVRKRVCFTVDL